MLLKHNPEFCKMTGKKKYETIKKAKRGAIRIMRKNNKSRIKYVETYKCLECKTYHWRVNEGKW